MGMPRSRHAHTSRTFVHSNLTRNLDDGAFSSPYSLKSAFQRTMTFCNKRDQRSYAQVLSSPCDSLLHKSERWLGSTGK